jgi:flagellar biogenesis protein FliO
MPKVDAAVQRADYTPTVSPPATTPNEPTGRKLAPPSHREDSLTGQRDGAPIAGRRAMDFSIPTHSLFTIATSLTVVIGAFLLFTWALRRGSKGRGRISQLPDEAVSVLGRVPIAARQFAELLRVGNKLVLVALTPNGPTTLTEVTDAVEVDRIVGMCQQFNPHSSTKAFQQVFEQFTSEPAAGGFLGEEPMPMSLSAAASAYRSQRGSARA